MLASMRYNEHQQRAYPLRGRTREQQTMSTKTKTLQHLTEHLSLVTDTLGKPIDPGIFELVVLLNALGMKTTGSCEGHFERLASPWVDIAVAIDPSERRRAIETLARAEYSELPEGERARLFTQAQRLF